MFDEYQNLAPISTTVWWTP